MPEEIQATVRIPVSEIVASLRKKHGLPSKLTGARIDGNIIVLNFAEGGQEPLELLKSKSPLENVEVRSEGSKDNEDAMQIAESMSEAPVDNEDPMQIAESMSKESTESEEARERKRFWKK